MIKLSVPAFDSTSPLRFAFKVRSYTYDIPSPPGQTYSPFEVCFYVDAFVGWVRFPAESVEKPTAIGFRTFDTEVRLDSPSAVGLRGGEGWFTLEALSVCWVTDCQITYTPATASDGRAPETHLL